MFKLESYLTPILLSYVDKYIKNFRPEDAQVSLWGGDASFHNLDLRLEVLEQELHLPLSFISGHIHDLIIHVPWTKLASEPITITINTIECILKLKEDNKGSESGSSFERRRECRRKVNKSDEIGDIIQPPGYMQNLVNKIVNNICINCNNLILKYVEEDIVVSVNIRMLKLSSANQKWIPVFAEVTKLPHGFIFLRKLLTITDLTICLDKRNAAGKIDVYQEPMLYRCSLELRILQCYHPLNKKYSVLRVDVHCTSLEFSMTELQMPMLMRLILLSQILMQRCSKTSDADITFQTDDIDSEGETDETDSWTGWAWSLMPSLFSNSDTDCNYDQLPQPIGHSLHFGIYVDNLSFLFKISECTTEGNFYVQKKIKYWPLLQMNIKGIYCNILQHGPVWSNIQTGISQIIVIPQGNCCCGILDVIDGSEPQQYLQIGANSTKYTDDSLFDVSSAENNNIRRIYNVNWNQHLQAYSETMLLELTPAFAMDICHQLELTEDITLEKIASYNGDLEYSNINERKIMRCVLGTTKLKVCSGLIHRIMTVYKASMSYDYSPYEPVTEEYQHPSELKPPIEDDFDALNEFIPQNTFCLTTFNMNIEIFISDHTYFEPDKGNLRRRRKGSTGYLIKPTNLNTLPRLSLEIQCIDAKVVRPIYPNRLIYTTCQLPDPPTEMLEACYQQINVKVLGLSGNVIVDDKNFTLLLPLTLTISYKEIIYPVFWLDTQLPHIEIIIRTEKCSFMLTKATLLTTIYILKSLSQLDDKFKTEITNSTLLYDISSQSAPRILEIHLEGIQFRNVTTITTVTYQTIISSIKGFIVDQMVKSLITQKRQHFQSKLKNSQNNNSTIKETQKVIIISGPEIINEDLYLADVPFFSAIIQYSRSKARQVHPSFLTFHIGELKLNFDPLLSRWLQYEPKSISRKESSPICICLCADCCKKRNYSDSAGTTIDTPRRTLATTHESVHSSEREKEQITNISCHMKELKEQKGFFDQASEFYSICNNIILFGTISHCIIYFPTKTLMSYDALTIQEALESRNNANKDVEVFMLKMPIITTQNSAHLQGLNRYITRFPIQVPETMWQPHKTLFPWTIHVENLSCWTLQNGDTLRLIKSLSWKIAIDVSVKYNAINSTKKCDSCGFIYERSNADMVNTLEIKYSSTALFCSNCSTYLNSLTNMDLRVYVDTPPVQINISDQQVFLISHLLMELYHTFSKFYPNCINNNKQAQCMATKHTCVHHKLPNSTPSLSFCWESTPYSESVSESPPEIIPTLDIAAENDPVKLSALCQWTLSRLRINVFSQDLNYMNDETTFTTSPDIKMVITIEDMFTSVNIQKIYMKVETKIASTNIYHYKRVEKPDGSLRWKTGPFLGLIMRCQDEDNGNSSLPENQGSFLKITITRARCDHVQRKWGALPHAQSSDTKTELKMNKEIDKVTYITEIDVVMQPIDILISIVTLKNFIHNFNSSFQIKTNDSNSKLPLKSTSELKLNEYLYNLNNHQLPLLYLDCRSLRIIMPANELVKKDNLQDTCILQISNVNLKPSAKNPICRTPLRPDLYQQAVRAHILNIPGADIEDRQYELNILELTVASENWAQLAPILSPKTILNVTSLRTMNENPALEWNNLEDKHFNLKPRFSLTYIINSLNISVIFAPAIVSSNNLLICGHSLELNILSDLELQLCMSQLLLAIELITECKNLFKPTILSKFTQRKANFQTVYNDKITSDLSQVTLGLSSDNEEYVKDSGIEVGDSCTSPTFIYDKYRRLDNNSSVIYETTQTGNKQLQLDVPVDILLTGGNISLILYQFELMAKSSYYHHYSKSLVKQDDQGYDASEEGSQEDLLILDKRTQPLLYFLLGQPNVYISRLAYEKKMHFSIYDIKILVNTTENSFVNGIPGKQHFDTCLVETKPGQPNVSTGILPAFLTVKWTQRTTKIVEATVEISRPTKIQFSIECWNVIRSLNHLLNKIISESSLFEKTFLNKQSSQTFNIQNNHFSKQLDVNLSEFNKFRELQDKLFQLNALHFQCTQIVLILKTRKNLDVIFASEKISSHLTVKNRPERITNILLVECITLSFNQLGSSHMLLNPWSTNTEINLFWEPWQEIDSNPQISISAESDFLRLDIGSEHLWCIETIISEYQEFINSFILTSKNDDSSTFNAVKSSLLTASEKDQHYKDDLRAGAFQFVDATVVGEVFDELPLPYQVLFVKYPQTTMSWRYPQPRALTKVRVFPIPFKDSGIYSKVDNQQVLCCIEYWSEAENVYKPFTQFKLSESELYQIDVPRKIPQSAVSCIWRVLLLPSNKKDACENSIQNLLSPQALAACVRIDSYFNPNLIPSVQISINISTIQLHLYNYFNQNIKFKMPHCLKEYTPDQAIPRNQCFLVFNVEKSHIFTNLWSSAEFFLEFQGFGQCFVLDYAFLTRQHFIEQTLIQFNLGLSDHIDLTVSTKPIKINFSPSVGHTLAISMELWEQTWTNRDHFDSDDIEMVILSRYVICNDTTMTIRFGQTATGEDILLKSRHCHLYCWRSQKSKQLLRVAINSNGWKWSIPFEIETNGTKSCMIEGKKNEFIFITVKSLSTTQKKIIFSGELIVVNNLNEQLELKVLSVSEPKEIDGTYIIPGKYQHPSLCLGTDKLVKMRVRYFGIGSAWSGDIPLMKNTSCDQPWLVKVPLHEHGHFLSIWCQIITQNFNGNKRYLAVFWPLFMIKSNLPVDAKVNIETPTLQVSLETIITGRGKIQQLYCPGTTDHSHQLTFKLESSSPSNPYVPLNYSLINQKDFFKKTDNQDIDEILSIIQNYEKSNWPFYEQQCNIQWHADDQPLTHVQIRYDKICPYSCSLLIELLPWCLLMNITGYPIAVFINAQEVCRIRHYGIAAPPKFIEPFSFGIDLNGMWHVSNSIELSSIPILGCYSLIVNCDTTICRLLIRSYEQYDIRLIHVECSHTLTNVTDFDLMVCCLAVPKRMENQDVPSNLALNSFHIPAKMGQKMNAVPLAQWMQYGDCGYLNVDDISFYLFISIDNIEFSQPIQVDHLIRQPFSVIVDQFSLAFVITVNELDGCYHINIHRDIYPQLVIENNTKYEIVVREFVRENEKTENEIGSFNWRCVVKSKSIRHYTMPTVVKFFPDISRSFIIPKLTIATNFEDNNGKYEWSQGIDVTTSNETYIRTSKIGDIKVTVVLKCHTTQVVIDSVSQVEFSAGDVRNRLQMIFKEKPNFKSFCLSANDTILKIAEPTNEINEFGSLLIEESQSYSLTTSSQNCKNNKNVINNPSPSNNDRRSNNSPAMYKIKSVFQINLNINVAVEGIVLTLAKDHLNNSYKMADICALYLDELVVRFLESEEEKNISLNIGNIQIDNQLYNQEMYDFSVMFVFDESNEDENELPPIKSAVLNNSINNTFVLQKKSVDLNIIMKKWTAMNHLQITEELSGIHTICLKIRPFKAFIETEYLQELMNYIKSMMPINLVILSQMIKNNRNLLNPNYIFINNNILLESEFLAKPIKINLLVIESVVGTLSVRSQAKIYIALDDSPISFPNYQCKNITTTPYHLGYALAIHFLSAAIVGAGWMVGALELLGNPGGLARSVGTGLKEFISKPYEGIMNGPWGLVVGVSQGSASLVKNVTAGTINSISKFAGSLARNLDRMSLDGDHLQRVEESRRQRPSGMVSQIAHGFTHFGISILGAVGGLAQQPLQSVVSEGASPVALATGVGKGLMGIITKPIGGAAELVSITGNAILQETGWKAFPTPRCVPVFHYIFNADNASVKYSWKFLPHIVNSETDILCDTETTMIGVKREYQAVALILTSNELILINTDEDITQKVIPLKDLEPVFHVNDPTLLSFNFIERSSDENILEMDPTARARVVDYVRNTVSGLSDISSFNSDASVILQTDTDVPKPALMFYVNPQWRNHFLNILLLAKRQSNKKGFPVL